MSVVNSFKNSIIIPSVVRFDEQYCLAINNALDFKIFCIFSRRKSVLKDLQVWDGF